MSIYSGESSYEEAEYTIMMTKIMGNNRWSHSRRALEKSSKRQAPFQSLGHGESGRLFTESTKSEM
jgi:hypothetical protein